jgi:uncharacterized protein (DUF849 family)
MFPVFPNSRIRSRACGLHFSAVRIRLFMANEMLIQAAMNGGRKRAEHPAIPVSPAELAASASECVAAGAGALHFHVRGLDGRESLEPDDVAAAVSAVRAAVPKTPLGVSTGAWILNDAKRRLETVARWKVAPDYASVNFKEEGAAELARLLLSRGIGIEVGFMTTEGLDVFLASGVAAQCLRILIEPAEEKIEAAMATVARIEAALDHDGVKVPRLLHGFNASAWDVIDAAAARGYDTRVGFVDVLTLPDGSRAPTNAALVAEAVRRTGRRAH